MSRPYCSCPAFAQMVAAGIIKEKTHQVLNTATGKLTHLHYYYLGPRQIEKCVVFPHCPACGRRVKVNAVFERTVAAMQAKS